MNACEVLSALDAVVDEYGWAYASEVADELDARGHGRFDGRTIRPWITELRKRGLVETRMGNAGDKGYTALVYGLTERGADVLVAWWNRHPETLDA